MFRSTLICCLYFLAITPHIYAFTDEQRAQIRQHFEEKGLECMKESPITAEDIAALRSKTLPTGPNAACFIACMLRKVGVMDDKGLLQKESALEVAKQVFHDEEELTAIHDFIHSCSHINSEAVSDGDKGCDRAVLAFTCMATNAAKFDLEI